jgi:ribosomal protein S18 acetylase RimI-like enzyme
VIDAYETRARHLFMIAYRCRHRTARDPDPAVAATALTVQQRAYRIEAELIGSDAIPPLHDTPATLRASGETFHGYMLDGALAGIIAYKRTGDLLDIHRLAVHPRYFRRGIAQALLAHVTAIEQGVARTIVSTGAGNQPAHAFYLRQGFRVVGEREVLPGLRITEFAR